MFQFEKRSSYNRGRRTTPQQKQILIAAMATNVNILECSSGDSAMHRGAKDEVWRRVMYELNTAGPKKHIGEWKKVWTDLRLGMRKKWQKAQRSQHILTEYERRVIDACGMIKKPGQQYTEPKSANEINSFLAFLNEEQEPIQDQSDYSKDENSSSYFLDDSVEFIISQPTDVNIKGEFGEEYEQPHVECISDHELNKFEVEFREPSVELISDDEEPNTVKIESPPHSLYEYDEPILTETIPQPIELQSPEMSPVQSLPLPMPLPLPTHNKNIPRRKNIRNATLKEIKKMHRSLLRESKKQTSLLRKLVRGIQH